MLPLDNYNLLITVLLVDLLVAEVLKCNKCYCILQAVSLSEEKHVWNLFKWHLADSAVKVWNELLNSIFELCL